MSARLCLAEQERDDTQRQRDRALGDAAREEESHVSEIDALRARRQLVELDVQKLTRHAQALNEDLERLNADKDSTELALSARVKALAQELDATQRERDALNLAIERLEREKDDRATEAEARVAEVEIQWRGAVTEMEQAFARERQHADTERRSLREDVGREQGAAQVLADELAAIEESLACVSAELAQALGEHQAAIGRATEQSGPD